jgi:hypothetical protein
MGVMANYSYLSALKFHVVKTLLYSGIICDLLAITNSLEKIYFQKYLSWGDSLRGTSVYETFYNKSLKECALICNEISGCVSFNMNDRGTCEINTTPFNWRTSYLIKESSWNVFEKGNCGLGMKSTRTCILSLYGTVSDWYGSREVCRSGHGDLVKIASQADADDISKLLAETYGQTDTHLDVWIGLNKVSSNDFIWPDMTKMNFNSFGEGQPYTGLNCVLLSWSSNSYSWKSADCSNLVPYICERNK